jgi:hypothetical protein
MAAAPLVPDGAAASPSAGADVAPPPLFAGADVAPPPVFAGDGALGTGAGSAGVADCWVTGPSSPGELMRTETLTFWGVPWTFTEMGASE